jgi:uncharacterized protein YoxC
MAPLEALIQVVAGARDTVYVKQVASDPGLLQPISAVASAIITVALLVLTVVAVPVAWHFRKTYRKINHLLDRVYGDITPIMRHASAITDNINFVTTSIRTDVQKVNATIASANERVQQAVAMTEERLHEFNALLAVVQAEAEDVFITTASTIRGARSGAAAFHARSRMDLASDELESADPVDPTDDPLVRQEEFDGDDSSPESAETPLGAGTAAPRIRPRARNQRD